MMRENKKFFDKTRLNKGYKPSQDMQASDVELIKNQYAKLLPPIDVVEQYEDLNPGTFQSMIEMSRAEQSNRHKIELQENKNHNKLIFTNKIFCIICILIIALTTTYLAFINKTIIAIIFAIAGFSALTRITNLFDKKQKKNRGNERFSRSRQRPMQKSSKNN